VPAGTRFLAYGKHRRCATIFPPRGLQRRQRFPEPTASTYGTKKAAVDSSRAKLSASRVFGSAGLGEPERQSLPRHRRFRPGLESAHYTTSIGESLLKSFKLFLLGVTVALGSVASAQQIDFAFGMGTISAPAASQVPTINQPPVSLTGGLYPAFSGDVLLHKQFGIGGNIAWRASQATPPGAQPYRPILWDIDVVNCSYFSCTNYVTSSHFMGQFGAGLKLYAHGGFFVKPEVHLYLVNNNVEYSSSHAVRYGGSIGYTFGGSSSHY
jgi:hypothetical protein